MVAVTQTKQPRARKLPPFTVLMSVYGGNTLRELERAVQSGTIEQTLPPAQLVIVRDGPVPADMQRYLDSLPSTIAVWFAAEHPNMPTPKVTIVPLSENQGLAHALNVGLQYCDYEYIARADCDDVSLPDRFATIIPQFIAYEQTHSNNGRVDAVGSAIREFSDDEDSPGQVRMLPTDGKELARYARLQSPLHHPSVVFRKSAVLAAGGYPENAGRFEDYLLWERMMLNHANFLNVPEPLVLYRTNEEAYERRGGFSMFVEECRLQWRFMRDGFTTPLEFLRNITVRTVYRLTPTSLRRHMYHSLVARRNDELSAEEAERDKAAAEEMQAQSAQQKTQGKASTRQSSTK